MATHLRTQKAKEALMQTVREQVFHNGRWGWRMIKRPYQNPSIPPFIFGVRGNK